MITIIKNTKNKVALTLSEESSLTTQDWLLKLTNDVTGAETQRVVALHDISEPPSRANIFEITESDSEDLLQSVVSLSPSGQWTYEAYEMAPSSPRNMDPSQAVKLVEAGRCLVVDPYETHNNFFDEHENKNSPVFEG